ncbi:MAG: hypothetical protein RLZZ450_1289 [Pseudomonadota bacterium]|jgi:hypothetical protein
MTSLLVLALRRPTVQASLCGTAEEVLGLSKFNAAQTSLLLYLEAAYCALALAVVAARWRKEPLGLMFLSFGLAALGAVSATLALFLVADDVTTSVLVHGASYGVAVLTICSAASSLLRPAHAAIESVLQNGVYHFLARRKRGVAMGALYTGLLGGALVPFVYFSRLLDDRPRANLEAYTRRLSSGYMDTYEHLEEAKRAELSVAAFEKLLPKEALTCGGSLLDEFDVTADGEARARCVYRSRGSFHTVVVRVQFSARLQFIEGRLSGWEAKPTDPLVRDISIDGRSIFTQRPAELDQISSEGTKTLFLAIVLLSVTFSMLWFMARKWRRRLRSPIWRSPFSRIVAAEVDATGLLEALVYTGDEFDDGKRWLLVRWERDHGVVWDHPFNIERAAIPAVYRDSVIFPSRPGEIVAVDLKTGILRWKTQCSVCPSTDPVWSDALLLMVDEERGAWAKLDPTSGALQASGALSGLRHVEELVAGSTAVAHYHFSSEQNIGANEILGSWPEDLQQEARDALASFCDDAYRAETFQHWLLTAEQRSRRMMVVVEREESFNRFAIELIEIDPFARQNFWRYRLGSRGENWYVGVAQMLGQLTAIQVHGIADGTSSNQYDAMFIVDLQRRRVLAEISRQNGSWILTPDGAKRNVAV